MQHVIHYFLHLVFPLLVAFVFFKDKWLKSYIILLLTMLVDLDHLFATPIFDPCRCSIGFHPLHSYVAIAIYAVLLIHPKIRVVSVGLLMHMATDALDCSLSNEHCF